MRSEEFKVQYENSERKVLKRIKSNDHSFSFKILNNIIEITV